MRRHSSTPRLVRRAKALWGLLAAAVALAPATALAQPTPSIADRITVEPGATCLDATALVDDVRTWLGEGTIDADLSIEVQGSPRDPRAVAFRVLRSGRPIAQRRFDPAPARCDHMHAALGLAIAMALRASLVDEIAPERVGTPPPPTAREGEGRPWSRRSESPWGLRVAPLGAVAVLPDPALGGELGLERIVVQFLGVRLSAMGLAARNETFDAAPGRFDATLWAGRFDLCAGVSFLYPVRVRGCVGLAAGVIRAQGYGYPQSLVSVLPWLAVADDLEIEVRIDPQWSVEGAVSLILPLGQNSLVVRDFSGAALAERRLASFGGFLALGPVLRF